MVVHMNKFPKRPSAKKQQQVTAFSPVVLGCCCHLLLLDNRAYWDQSSRDMYTRNMALWLHAPLASL